MAIFRLWSAEQEQIWQDWVNTRPLVIQEMCKTHVPNRLYRLSPTDQLVTLSSLNEDGTVTVVVDPRFNVGQANVGHGVFDVLLENLIECDLPDGMAPDPAGV